VGHGARLARNLPQEARRLTTARYALLLVAGLAGCDHSFPFQSGEYGPDGPFGSGVPTRLTLNPGHDFGAAWLPGGAGIMYSAERLDRADRDRCLAVQPPAGGVVTAYSCRTTAANDSLDVFENAAVSDGGRVAYVRVASHRFPVPLGPDALALVVGTVNDPAAGTVVRPMPFALADGDAAAHIAWLDETRLIYVAQRVRYPIPCRGCAPDTVSTGLRVVMIDLGGSGPVLTEIAGTDSASSVAVGATSDTIYFTRNGDSRVYRYAFSGGDTATVHDFGFAGIARDLSVAAGRLVAVVGGDVSYVVDSILGPSQIDNGGPLCFVTLATGAETVFGADTSRFRRPALSPDGTRVAFEDWITQRPDLFLMSVP
jgi:hypothetical protein